MTLSKNIETILGKASWIRKMFEEGARLKAEHGADKVFDFSLGNPNVPPPAAFRATLAHIVSGLQGNDHGYMPNTGYPDTCSAVAAQISGDQGVALDGKDIIMTCGAAGGLNIILKAVLNPGEEVLTPTPCFVEYGFYAGNHGGVLKTVPTREDFSLDLTAIEQAITAKTRVVLINSPNNPTGQIYSESDLKRLGEVLKRKSEEYGAVIYLVADEPYRKIVYDDVAVPGVFPCYRESIVASSYSKEISIPGERLGFVALHPQAQHHDSLYAGMALANRILGFVNAPALMQRVVAALKDAAVDVSAYARKRALLCDGLAACGYDFVTPPGAFYLFPKAPGGDDVAFARTLQEELILAVPGSGFFGPGHFRLAFCVDDDTIINAMPGFKRAMERVG